MQRRDGRSWPAPRIGGRSGVGRRSVRRARDRPCDPTAPLPDRAGRTANVSARARALRYRLLERPCRRDRRRPDRHRAPCRRSARDVDHAAQPRRRGRRAGRGARPRRAHHPPVARLAACRTGRVGRRRRASSRSTIPATSATGSTARGCARCWPRSTGSMSTVSARAPRALGDAEDAIAWMVRPAGGAIVLTRRRWRVTLRPTMCRSSCAGGWSSAASRGSIPAAEIRGRALVRAVRMLDAGERRCSATSCANLRFRRETACNGAFRRPRRAGRADRPKARSVPLPLIAWSLILEATKGNPRP